MKPAYIHLIEYILGLGDHDVLVDDGGECDEIQRFSDAAGAIEAVEAVESAQVGAVKQGYDNSHVHSWAIVIWGWGMAPEETVVDYTANAFMGKWENTYDREVLNEPVHIDTSAGHKLI